MNPNDEVIALRIHNDIYFGELAHNKALETKTVHQIYTRDIFYFMADMDLDPKWKKWADNAPTLFLRSKLEKWGIEDVK